MLRMILRTSLLLLAATRIWAGPCATTTLDQYQALTANVGCTVGPLIFENFSFSVLSSSGSPLLAAATDILVTPQAGAEFGLSFSSAKFAESGPNAVTYAITYAEDPTGSIRSLDSVLNDPVTAPGRGEVDSLGCLDGMFTALNVCSSSNLTPTVAVFDAGGVNHVFSASANFAGVHVLGIQETILLTGDSTNTSQSGGSVSITSFGNQSSVPEPGTAWLAGAAFLALLFAGKSRLKRKQV